MKKMVLISLLAIFFICLFSPLIVDGSGTKINGTKEYTSSGIGCDCTNGGTTCRCVIYK